MTDHTDNTALLPCPFCGGDANLIADSEHSTAYIVTHYNPACIMDEEWSWAKTEKDAAAAWNTRTNASTIADAERRGREAALLAAADACQGVSSHARWHDNSVQSKGASRCHAAILALRTSPDTVPISWDTRPCRIEDME